MLERDIENHLVKGVRRIGGEAYKFVSPSNRGVSDRLVVLPGGKVWFIEVKREGGKLSALQKLFAQRMGMLGTNYACLWSKEDVDQWLTARGQQ